MKELLKEKLHDKHTWIVLGVVALAALLSLLSSTLAFFIVLALSICLIRERLNFMKTKSTLEDANSHIEALKQYEGLIDVEKEMESLRNTAIAEVESMRNSAREDAEAIRNSAKEEAESMRNSAIAEVEQMRSSAEEDINSQVAQAQQMVDEQLREASETIAEAEKITKRKEEYEKIVRALKNTIEGYGTLYLKPTHSLLDELAEEFGHTEAGEQLKAAREASATMVVNNTAATCDYSESSRKQTAISFVLDAFNGKVDSILSKTKKDNYGTLEQKIKDAFFLVNKNGTAFKNARIRGEYLLARLNELKWGTIVYELRVQAQEEQKRLREQIREEERARREYEKAIKDAEKEEELLRKAMEKAQAQIAAATDSQKAKYEEKLAELGEKLKLAEERGQRAVSMAQQTKRGNVYVISNIGSFGEDVFKVGMTRRLDPLERVKELGDASVPFPFDVHAIIESDDAPGLEAELHKALYRNQVNKVNPRKEFFRLKLTDIREIVEQKGLNANWTMVAAAMEYRETLAIEKEIASDPVACEKWEKSLAKNYSEAHDSTDEE